MRRLKDPVVLLLAVLLAVIAAMAVTAGKPGPKPIPNRGQLMLAAAAYASLQADSNGVTVLRQRVVSVKLRPDGTVAAIVHMTVQGVDAKGSLDLLVILKHSLWRGVRSSVLRTHVN